MSYDVFGLGNALVDALVILDERSLLQEHDLSRGTMHLVNDARWRGVYNEVSSSDVVIHPGGSSANAVSTVALLGGQATFCGLIGQDELGDRYSAGMADALGGQHKMVRREGLKTGKCLSLVSDVDAERTMVTDLGASMQLMPDDLPMSAIEDSTWLHVTGYLFTGGTMGTAAYAALDRALQAGTKISFDLGDAFVIDHFRDEVDRVIDRYANVVFMNEEEARKLHHDDAMEAMHTLAKRVDTVVLKLGKRGSLVKRGDDVIPIEALVVDAIDTTGAGDSYAGGFLYGLSQKWSLEDCGHLASSVAALTVGQMGGVIRDAEALARAKAEVVVG